MVYFLPDYYANQLSPQDFYLGSSPKFSQNILKSAPLAEG